MEVKCPKCGLVADCNHSSSGWTIMGGTVAEVIQLCQMPDIEHKRQARCTWWQEEAHKMTGRPVGP
jgi:hypothetical protein